MPLTLENTSRRVRRRASIIALLLLLLVPLSLTSGCNPFAPPPPVADSVEQAFKDGEAKEADAEKAASFNDKTEATERWTKTATYYGAVANKFKGTDNGLRAVLEQVDALDKANNRQTAWTTLKAALRQYTPATAPQTYATAQERYTTLVRTMDEENSKTFQYKVMDTLVRMFGNDPKWSPVAAVFFIAIAVTLLVWPFRVKQYRSFKELQRYQPELQRIQKKYKDDPQTAMLKQQEFYKEHGINQFAGCLPMLLQMPITLFMYQVIMYYQFHFTQSTFLWINPSSHGASLNLPPPLTGQIGANLGENDLLLLIVYAISMFLTTKLMPTTPATDPQMAEQQKMMTVTMPIIFFVMMLQWQPASAFVLYWLVSNILGLGQQWAIYRTLPSHPPLIIASKDGGDTASDGATANGDSGTSDSKALTANPKLVSPKNKKKK
jgi:YidC/Oxa1 family membrane protein insertase